MWEPDTQRYAVVDAADWNEPATSWGIRSLGTWTQGRNKTIDVDGVEYTFRAQGSYYVLEPSAGTYSE